MSAQRLPAHQDALESPGSGLPWQELVASIYHHRKMVISIISVGVGLSLLWTWITPPEYRAKALLMVKGQRAQMTVSPDGRSQQIINTEQQESEVNSLLTLAYQPSLAEAVLETARKRPAAGDGGPAVEVKESWVVKAQDTITWAKYFVLSIPDRLYRRLHGIPPPTPLESSIARLQAELQLTPLPGSNLVEVAYQSRSPFWAKRVVDAYTTELISTYTRLHESEDAHRFYQKQRSLLADTLSKAEAELVAFRERVGTDLLSLNINDLQTRIADLELELIDIQGRKAELEAQINAPDQAIVADAAAQDTEAGTVANPVIAQLKARLTELEMERSQLLSRYTPTSAAVRDIDRQIAEARRILAQERSTSIDMYRKTARARLEATDARVAALNAQLAKYHDTLGRLERVFPEWNRLQNNAQTQKEAYLNYLRKEEEARVSSALDESQLVNISIAERAQRPSEPAPGGVKRRLFFGGVFSTLLAVGLALLKDGMDPSVKSAYQAERLAGLPVLGELQS